MYGVRRAIRACDASLDPLDPLQTAFIALATAVAISVATEAFGYPFCSPFCTSSQPKILSDHNDITK